MMSVNANLRQSLCVMITNVHSTSAHLSDEINHSLTVELYQNHHSGLPLSNTFKVYSGNNVQLTD